MPTPVVGILQIVVAISAVVWLNKLAGVLPECDKLCRPVRSLPFVAFGAVAVILLAHLFFYRLKYIGAHLVLSLVLCVMISSNHLALAERMKSGQTYMEFKKLADWYVEHAEKGEKLVTSLPHTLSIFAPEYRRSFVHMDLKADSPDDFVKKCYERNITYVTWDSMGGRSDPKKNRYYGLWGFKNIAMLIQPTDNGPYQFITTIRPNEKGHYINVFRLRRAPAKSKE